MIPTAIALSMGLIAIPLYAQTPPGETPPPRVEQNHHLSGLTGLDAATLDSMTMTEIGALIAARRARSG